MKYIRTHIPSGRTDVLPFNTSHDQAFAPENIRFTPKKQLDRIAKSHLEKWNRQQPATYKYELKESDAKSIELKVDSPTQPNREKTDVQQGTELPKKLKNVGDLLKTIKRKI